MAKLQIPVSKGRFVEEPPIAKFLFSDKRAAWLWLPIRIWLGVTWIEAAASKVTNPGWLTGTSLKSSWERMTAIPATGSPPIRFDFYRDFLKGLLDGGHYTWFGPLVAWGELLVGIALVIGAFVGIAAFFGSFMNWNFIMAGTASTNGLLLAVGVFIALAWKVAGYIGADYFLLRFVGVPWKGEEAKPKESPAPAAGK
jgi:thiosulfate dehydrogenase [quinone] large subunit